MRLRGQPGAVLGVAGIPLRSRHWDHGGRAEWHPDDEGRRSRPRRTRVGGCAAGLPGLQVPFLCEAERVRRHRDVGDDGLVRLDVTYEAIDYAHVVTRCAVPGDPQLEISGSFEPPPVSPVVPVEGGSVQVAPDGEAGPGRDRRHHGGAGQRAGGGIGRDELGPRLARGGRSSGRRALSRASDPRPTVPMAIRIAVVAVLIALSFPSGGHPRADDTAGRVAGRCQSQAPDVSPDPSASPESIVMGEEPSDLLDPAVGLDADDRLRGER